LAESGSTSLGRTVAGAGGRFFLPDLSSGLCELLVRRPGQAVFHSPGLEIPETGAADFGRIVLPGGETLTGRVVDPQGSPLAGVEVWMMPTEPTATAPWGAEPFTRTGADGRFTVTGLAPQAAIVLSLCHEGSLPEKLVLGSLPAEPVTVTLRPAGVLSGTVEGPDGAPVPGALVYTRRTGGLHEETLQACATADQEVTTDGEGRFALPPLEPGWYTVFAQGKGFRRGRIDRLEVRAGPGSPLRFALERGAALAGRVSGPAGEPVYRAAVSIVRNGHGVQAMTDTDGRYRLEGLDTGSVAVTVWAIEQAYAETKQSTEIVPGENGLDIALAAAPPRPEQHAVYGRVVGPRGEAVPGAIVSAPGARAVSAVDGSFQLSLPEGKATLSAESADYPLGGRTIVEVSAAGVLRGVEIRLLPRVELKGRLTGLAADETAWAWVMATSSDLFRTIRGRVSADGSYLVAPLAAGDWRLVAGTGGRLTSPRSLHIEPGEAAVAADLDFPPVSPVSGRVAEAGGEPVAQAEVLFSSMESSVTATTRADGSFEARLADGEYSVKARRWGSEAETPYIPLVVAGAAAGLEIRLPPAIELHGLIRGLAPGQIPTIQIADPFVRAGTVDAGGAFHLSGLRPGIWTLRVKLDAESDNLPRLLTANVTVHEGDTDIEMDLTFPPEDAPPP
jgi:protocatechuate 3,4-dioxygenase beta subunit